MHAVQLMPPMRSPGQGDNCPPARMVERSPDHRSAACTTSARNLRTFRGQRQPTWHHLERGPSTCGYIPGAATSIHGPQLRLDVPPFTASGLPVQYVSMFVGVLWRSTHKHHNKQVKIVTGNTSAVTTRGLLGDAEAQQPSAKGVEVEGTIIDNVTLDNA